MAGRSKSKDRNILTIGVIFAIAILGFIILTNYGGEGARFELFQTISMSCGTYNIKYIPSLPTIQQGGEIEMFVLVDGAPSGGGCSGGYYSTTQSALYTHYSLCNIENESECYDVDESWLFGLPITSSKHKYFNIKVPENLPPKTYKWVIDSAIMSKTETDTWCTRGRPGGERLSPLAQSTYMDRLLKTIPEDYAINCGLPTPGDGVENYIILTNINYPAGECRLFAHYASDGSGRIVNRNTDWLEQWEEGQCTYSRNLKDELVSSGLWYEGQETLEQELLVTILPPEPLPCADDTECPLGTFCYEGFCELAICPSEYAPVCGMDDNTYMNHCTALANRVQPQCEGECPCKINFMPILYGIGVILLIIILIYLIVKRK